MDIVRLFGRPNPIQHPNNTIVIDTSGTWSGINENTYIEFIKRYEELRDEPEIIVDITTEGGSITYALMIAETLSKHEGNTIAKVTRYALSGGTIIALACKELHMTPYANLSPVDPQRSGFLPSIKHLKNAVANVKQKEFAEPSFLEIFTSYLTSHLSDIENSFSLKFNKILKRRYTKENIIELDALFRRKYEHNFPISPDELPPFMLVKYISVEKKQAPVNEPVSTDVKHPELQHENLQLENHYEEDNQSIQHEETVYLDNTTDDEAVSSFDSETQLDHKFDEKEIKKSLRVSGKTSKRFCKRVQQ